MPRILFVKTSSLGDVVHHCPAVTDVARRHPEAQIDWVVEAPFAEVAGLHPAVRRVIPVRIRRWRGALASPGTWREIAAFRRALRDARYDLVIDTQGLLKSAWICALAQGERHGYDPASAREPWAARFYDRVHPVPASLHAVERNRRLTGASLGYVPEDPADYGLRVPSGGSMPAARFALLLTMTSREDKLWPEEHWRSLGARLEALGLDCVLPWGSEEERRRCGRIAAGLRRASVPPRMALGELARLAGQAACVVGVDTGLAHLAVAVGAPTLGLYCNSDPALTGLHGGGFQRNLGGIGRPPHPEDVAAAAAQALGAAHAA